MTGVASRTAVLSFASVLFFLFATTSFAQLQDTVWDEYLGFSAGDFSDEALGEDLSAPERLHRQWIGDGYFCEASVRFPPSLKTSL